MKKLSTIFSFTFLCCFAISLNAQMYVGPKLGINIANVGGDDVPDEGLKSLLGVQFGAVAEFNVQGLFTFQPELLYFQKGFVQEFSYFGETEKVDYILTYLEIPLLVKLKFGDTEGTHFFGTVGPSLGYGLRTKIKADGESETASFKDDELSQLDVSLSIGAGVGLPAGPGILNIEARYLLGLNSIIDDGDNDSSKVKNRGIGIGLSYLVPFGG